jgi:hypothetical protein
MLQKIFCLALLSGAVTLATSSTAHAWGAYHTGYTHVGPSGVQHYGGTSYSGRYGSYSGSHYGSSSRYGGYHSSYGSYDRSGSYDRYGSSYHYGSSSYGSSDRYSSYHRGW